MRCSYCGTEYTPGAAKCSGCGAKAEDAIGIKIEQKEENNNSQNTRETISTSEINEKVQNVEVQNETTSHNTIQSPSNTQQSSMNTNNQITNNSNNLKIIIMILIVIIACMIAFGIWYFVLRSDKTESNKDNTESKNNIKENVITSKEESKKSTVDFLGYTLFIPDGFVYNMYNGEDYIQNEECVIMYKSNNLKYDSILSNRETIISELEEKGYIVKSFEPKRMNNNNYVVLIAESDSVSDSIPKIEYGYVFGDIKGESPAVATITSSTIDSFNTDWFEYVAEFFSSAK